MSGFSDIADNAPWTTYTPTLSADTGTFTTATATGAYKKIGKTILLELNINITTVGTATGGVIATLPTGFTVTRQQSMFGREASINGFACAATIAASGTTARILKYDNTTMIAAGANLTMTGLYEIN